VDYHKLGRTGLKVSRLCLGTMTMGWTSGRDESFAVLDAFVEAGGNFVDTADVYSFWAEATPAVSLRRGSASGCTTQPPPPPNASLPPRCAPDVGGSKRRGLSRQHIIEAVDDSLRRLQTDFIDLYQTHWPTMIPRSKRHCELWTIWCGWAKSAISARPTTRPGC